MRVAILFSGGKDSAYAIEYAMQKKFEIAYLLTVKPTRKDCFLFHYSTAENAAQVAEMLGFRHVLINCDVADPKAEATLVREVVERDKVDALILGGIGLQVTQIKSLQDALLPLGVECFAAHAGYDHKELMEEMLSKGFASSLRRLLLMACMHGLVKRLQKKIFRNCKKQQRSLVSTSALKGVMLIHFV